MFNLENHPVDIKSHTARKEFHGDRLVLASTLSCETICANTVLDEFDHGLRPLLYRNASSDEAVQAEIPMEVTDGLVARRLPHVKPLVLDQKFPGYKLSMPSTIKQNDVIDIEKVDLSKLVFKALEGGSVRISFSLSFKVGWMNSGKLNHLIQETADMTLTPPGVEEESPQMELAATS